jgi:phosphoglycolate phosphatase
MKRASSRPARDSRPRKPAVKRAYKLILFDLDGTLAESLTVGLEVMNGLRLLFGYGKLDAADPRLRTVHGMAFLRDILGLSLVKMIAWVPLFKFLVVRRADEIGVYPGWNETLKKLKRRYPLGIVTSSPEHYARTVLKNGGFHDFVVLKTGVRYHRKDAAIAQIMAERGLEAGDILYIGDELRDLEACRAVKVHFAAVSWGKDHEDLFKARRRQIRALLSEPEDLLKELGLTRD